MFFCQYRESNLESYMPGKCFAIKLCPEVLFFKKIFNLRKGLEKLKFLRLVMNSLCSTGEP